MKNLKLILTSLIILLFLVANADSKGKLDTGIDVDIIQELNGNINVSGITCDKATVTIVNSNGTIIFQKDGLNQNGFSLTVQTENWTADSYIILVTSYNANCCTTQSIDIE